MQTITFDEIWPFLMKGGQKKRLTEDENKKYNSWQHFDIVDWDIIFKEKTYEELLKEVQVLRSSKYNLWDEIGALMKEAWYKRLLKAEIKNAMTHDDLKAVLLRLVDPIDELDAEINISMSIKKEIPKPLDTDIQ